MIVAAKPRHDPVVRVRFWREGDSRDAPPDGQLRPGRRAGSVEGQDPAIHWMAVTSTAMTQTGNSRLFLQQNGY
jgi:hypothetical protein